MAKRLKCWRVRGRYTPSRSIRWREKNKEIATFVQFNQTFVGDRKPEVNIWKQQKDQKNMARYILSGKKFKNNKEAIKFAKSYMKKHDIC